jgi:hypothetical protein
VGKWIFGDWTVSRDREVFHLTHGKHKLDMLGPWFYMFMSEHYQAYNDYLPPFSLHGKTVLDVGAWCGETAMFFQDSGAEKVIAIERDSSAFRFLQSNTDRNGWNVEAINEPFSLSQLSDLKFDFMKMDIEGGEGLLLTLQTPPCYSVIEVHSPNMAREFQDRFKASTIEQYDSRVTIMSVQPQTIQ